MLLVMTQMTALRKLQCFIITDYMEQFKPDLNADLPRRVPVALSEMECRISSTLFLKICPAYGFSCVLEVEKNYVFYQKFS